MFCERCGTQLPEEAQFCINCGASTKGEGRKETQEKVSDTEIQLRVQPTFKLLYLLLPSIITYISLAILPLILISIFSIIAGIALLVISSIIIVPILLIDSIIKKKQYDNYYFDFYKTKVIYRDSFLNLSEKEVKYKYIREVTMRQTFIQRYFNIGSIILFTNAETGYGNGIYIMNVENVQDVYRDIKSIIEV